MSGETSFLGSGWSFPPTFSADLGVHMVSDEEDVLQSLRILLSTSIGERLMQPSYGCDLHPQLFEPLDTTRRAYIKDLVRTAVLYHEPRIRLDSIVLESDDNAGRLEIEVQYTIRATNSRQNLVLPFYRDEGVDPIA